MQSENMLNSGRNNLWQIESHLVVLLPMAVVAWLLSRAALIVPKIWKMKLKRQCHHIQGITFKDSNDVQCVR